MSNALKGWLVILGIPLVLAGGPYLIGRHFMRAGWEWHQSCIAEEVNRAQTLEEAQEMVSSHCQELPN
jgi:hypothetical protein